MVSISCENAANELLRQCVGGQGWNGDLAYRLAQPECAEALFRILVEGLADRFERSLCDDYAAIFSLILERVVPEISAAELVARYHRIRQPKPCTWTPKRVAVLSRVTLGADIAITSVLLNAARTRFPNAELWFVGSSKSAELFTGFPWIKHLDVAYARGTVPQRLEAWRQLARRFREDWLVIDPDSRLTQLGLLPIVEEDRYLFFESRSYGEDRADNLTTLAKRWAREVLLVEVAAGLIAPPDQALPAAGHYATVSLGTADNSAKQMPAAFESELIREVCAHYPTVIVDRGFGEDEAARVENAVAGTHATTWTGSFARFASIIAGSGCYVGYDSAGQHAAAALGTPLITLFKGFVNERMFARWQPAVSHPERAVVIREGVISIAAVRDALISFSRL